MVRGRARRRFTRIFTGTYFTPQLLNTLQLATYVVAAPLRLEDLDQAAARRRVEGVGDQEDRRLRDDVHGRRGPAGLDDVLDALRRGDPAL